MRTWLAGAVMIVAAAAHAEGLSARAVGPMVQVFPTSVPPGEPTAQLEAARGEWEPFQVVIHAAGGAPAPGRAPASPLIGAPAPAAPRAARGADPAGTTALSGQGQAAARSH